MLSTCASLIQHSIAKDRTTVRIGLVCDGRLAIETLKLLNDCQLIVKPIYQRQYMAKIPQLPSVEVWLRRPKDIVRDLVSKDLDLGIIGLETVYEYGQNNEDIIIVHDALAFGNCRLSLAVPNDGIFERIHSLDELSQMPDWTSQRPLKIATGFTHLANNFIRKHGMKNVRILNADGSLDAAPALGTADAIVDIVSNATTLKENSLKEIEGGLVLESQAVLVASRKSLCQRREVLDTTREILERLEAHLRAVGQSMVSANMRGSSAEEVAERVLTQPALSGLQGVAVNPVFCNHDGKLMTENYTVQICVPEKAIYQSVKQLRKIGGYGVLISPLIYIFEEESPKWRLLLSKLESL